MIGQFHTMQDCGDHAWRSHAWSPNHPRVPNQFPTSGVATSGELVWHEWMIWGAKHGFKMRDQHSYYFCSLAHLLFAPLLLLLAILLTCSLFSMAHFAHLLFCSRSLALAPFLPCSNSLSLSDSFLQFFYYEKMDKITKHTTLKPMSYFLSSKVWDWNQCRMFRVTKHTTLVSMSHVSRIIGKSSYFFM